MATVIEPAVEADADLGRALQAGDAQGAEGLFLRYGQHIHDYAAHLTHDDATADDIVQATFVRAIEQAATLRDPAHVRAWLYAIADNLAREYLTRDREAHHPTPSSRRRSAAASSTTCATCKGRAAP
jgi:RNA polymerase sigma factor (sigma-70 family)